MYPPPRALPGGLTTSQAGADNLDSLHKNHYTAKGAKDAKEGKSKTNQLHRGGAEKPNSNLASDGGKEEEESAEKN